MSKDQEEQEPENALEEKLTREDTDERECFTCGWVGDYGEFMLINEGYECLECSEKNRTGYEKRKFGGEEESTRIELAKYENAQTRAWRDAWGQPYFELNEMRQFISDNGPNTCTNGDVELWADAPLLLAEVKRLYEGIEQLLGHDGMLDLLYNVGILEEEWTND